jgi:hypothetical protein
MLLNSALSEQYVTAEFGHPTCGGPELFSDSGIDSRQAGAKVSTILDDER